MSGEIKEIWKRYLRFASVLEPIALHQYAVIRTGRLNSLKLSGYYIYHFERLKTFAFYLLVLLRVLYGSHNKQYFHLEHYMTEWHNRGGKYLLRVTI